MTQADFTAFYPQFTGFTPAVVLTTYIAQANARFSSFSPEDAEEARRLYTAHRLTLYARVALPENTTPSKASSGTSSGSMSTQTDLADLTETSFGLQLLSLLKLYSMTRYVP